MAMVMLEIHVGFIRTFVGSPHSLTLPNLHSSSPRAPPTWAPCGLLRLAPPHSGGTAEPVGVTGGGAVVDGSPRGEGEGIGLRGGEAGPLGEAGRCSQKASTCVCFFWGERGGGG